MATKIINPAGGDDYLTLQAALDDNLSSNTFQIKKGGNVSQGVLAAAHNGSTIEAYPGDEADYLDTIAGSRDDGAYVFHGTTGHAIDVSLCSNITVRTIRAYRGGNGWQNGNSYVSGSGSSGMLVERCVIESSAWFFANYLRGSGVFRNCVVHDKGTNANDRAAVYINGAWSVYNNTVRSVYPGGYAVNSVHASADVRNIIACIPTQTNQYRAGWWPQTGPATANNNIGDGGSLTAFAAAAGSATGNQDNKTEAGVLTNFPSIDATPIVSGPADGMGENLYASFQDDFYGNPRPAAGAWTVGPFRFKPAGHQKEPSPCLEWDGKERVF